jgi:outer membrane immunogenic protein
MFMRISALILLISSVGVLRPAFADGQEYRTNTGPNGADFSGVELGVDGAVALGSASGANTSGPAGGAHVGYNFQAAHIVGGVEADVMFGQIKTGSLGFASFSQNNLASTRVKGGYAFGDILGYGTVGWGFSSAHYEDPSGATTKTIRGAVFGAGAEYALTRTVSVRAEYLRYEFGNNTYATPFSSKPIYTDTNLFRVGASVHF